MTAKTAMEMFQSLGVQDAKVIAWLAKSTVLTPTTRQARLYVLSERVFNADLEPEVREEYTLILDKLWEKLL